MVVVIIGCIEIDVKRFGIGVCTIRKCSQIHSRLWRTLDHDTWSFQSPETRTLCIRTA